MRALELEDLDERQRYIDQCCQEEPEISERLQSMVRAHQSVPEEKESGDRNGSLPNAQIFGENFELIKRLGEGGFGNVYLARQTKPLRRLVALKAIKPGMDSEEIIGRFRIEQGALAIMNHPGIAKVLATGETTDGRPFFVMEYVEGLPINEYCDLHRLTLRERLVLFCDCCHAIAHAHQKGVIHRDLKPSNVMVAEYDGVHLPKVIDFGIAKALTPELKDDSFQTEKFHLVGSPLYMSPEQAGRREFPIDTRTDVYSLGALLYQLVTGVPTFDPDRLVKEDLLATLEFIKDETVPTASNRFINLAADQQADCADKQRVTQVEHLKILEGEVSWIIAKAIAKNPDDRYQSVMELEQDIQNFLHDRPLNVKQPGRLYLVKKFIQRNSFGVGIGAAVALILVGSLVFSLWQLNRARLAEKQANKHRDDVVAANLIANQHMLDLGKTRDQLQEWVYTGDVGLAAAEEATGDISTALFYLRNQLPENSGFEWDMRGFEWYFLHQLLTREHQIIQQMQPGYSFLCCLPDTNWIATGHYSGVITLLDATTHEKIGQLVGHYEMVNHIDLSPDGKLLASAADDGRVCIWDLENRSLQKSFWVDKEFAYRAFFLADSRRLIVSGKESRVCIWDSETGKKITRLEGVEGNVKGRLAVAPDRSFAVLHHQEESLDWYSLQDDWKLIRQKSLGKGNGCRCLTISDDQRWLVSRTNAISISPSMISRPCRQRFNFDGHRDDIQSLSFHPQGDFFASSDKSGVVRFWNLDANSKVRSDAVAAWARPFVAHTDRVWSVDFSNDGSQLVTASKDGTVKAWKPQRDQVLDVVDCPGAIHACWKNENELFYSVKEELYLWDVAHNSSQKLATLPTVIKHIKFNAEAQKIAMGLETGEIYLHSADGKTFLRKLAGHAPHGINCFEFGPSNNCLVSTGQDDQVICWRLEDGEIIDWYHDPNEHSFDDVIFADKDTVLLCQENNVAKWVIGSGEKARNFLVGHQNSAECLTVCNERGLVITGSDDRTIKIWQRESGRLINTIEGHDYKINQISCSDTHRVVISGDDNGFVGFSHPLHGRFIMQYDLKRFWPQYEGRDFTPVYDVCFCPDDKKVAIVVSRMGILILDPPR